MSAAESKAKSPKKIIYFNNDVEMLVLSGPGSVIESRGLIASPKKTTLTAVGSTQNNNNNNTFVF